MKNLAIHEILLSKTIFYLYIKYLDLLLGYQTKPLYSCFHWKCTQTSKDLTTRPLVTPWEVGKNSCNTTFIKNTQSKSKLQKTSNRPPSNRFFSSFHFNLKIHKRVGRGWKMEENLHTSKIRYYRERGGGQLVPK